MSGESAPKPRLVLCPKCRLLLPESPDYDVYKCGGCGTILQAKRRKSRAVNSESTSLESDATPRNASNLVSDDRQRNNEEKLVSTQENGLREKATSTSSGECSSEGNDERGQVENDECNREQLVTSHENGLREKEIGSSSGECSSEGNGERDQIENGECNGEKLVASQENGLRAKETGSSSGECSSEGNGGKDQIGNGESNGDQQVTFQENGLIAKSSSSSTGECSLNGNGGRNPTENGDYNGEQLVSSQENGLKEKGTGSLSGECSSEENGGTGQIENGGCNEEKLITSQRNCFREKATGSSSGEYFLEGNGGSHRIENGEYNREQFMSALDIEDANDEKSAVVGLKSEVDTAGSDSEVPDVLNNGNLFLEGAQHELISGSDGDEVNNDRLAPVGANPESDINGTKKAESEELSHGELLLEGAEELNMCASDGEDLKNRQSTLVGAKSEVDITGSASTAKRLSAENLASEKESMSHVSPRKEGTSDNTEATNPSLGALSKSPTIRSSHAYDGSVSSNDSMDEQFPNQNLYSFDNTSTVSDGVSEGRSRKGKRLVDNMSYGDLETQHQSYFPNRRNHINKVPDAPRHGQAHWMRTPKNDFTSKIPLPRSGSQSGYERGSPSSQMHDELYGGTSSFLSPDSFEDPDQEKIKLLRMVYKLQEQLNRTSYANGETNGRLSNEIHVSANQSHDFREGRFYRDMDPPRWDGRYSHGINSHQRHNFSRIPYLPEPRSSANHVDHPYSHYHPQEWQCSSEEFPPHVLYQHEELYRSHPGHNCCSSNHSYPSSPQWFTASKPVPGRETKSCDQRLRAPEMRNYFREKSSLTRRHCRPVAGGAPFVTCYKCLKLLQLPADFLLFKRVCSELKCGECQEVLKFSLQNRSHIVSYPPNSLGPPSNELEDQNEVIGGSHPHSESHATADPISYSDDYDNSVVKSSSSDGDPVSLTPSHHLHHNPRASPGNFESVAEKDKIASRGPSTSKPPVHSSNMPSAMEAQPLPKSSPLHQLMGYSSPSLVLRGLPSAVEGEEPTHDGENDPSHNFQQS